MAKPILLGNYLKTAWRTLRRQPFYTSINILGLTLGISACLIIFLVTSFELSYDRFHPGGQSIYRVVTQVRTSTGEKRYMPAIPFPATATIRSTFSGLDKVAAFYNYYARVTIPDGTSNPRQFDKPKEHQDVSPIIIADPQYFDIFKYQWLAGEAATALDGPFKVVLTDVEAKRYFGDRPFADILGRRINYEDSLPVTVTGIVKTWEQHTDFTFRDFISSATIESSALKQNMHTDNWRGWSGYSQTFVKLAPGVNPDRIVMQTKPLIKEKMQVGHGNEVSIGLQSLSDIHFNAIYEDAWSRKAHLPTLYGLMGIAVFILLIAAINFINLSTAQSLRRAKETGIRKVLGGSRSSLVMQYLSETFILTSFSVLLSLAITGPVLRAFHSFIPEGVGLHPASPAIWIFLLAITLVTSLLAGFYPARVLSAFLPALSLKGQGSQTLNQKSYLRKSLIVFQFTISLVFIISTLVIGHQIHFMLSKDMGFTSDAIVNIRTDWHYGADKKQALAEKIRMLPGVDLASLNMGTPADKDHAGTIIKCAATNSGEIESQWVTGDPEYVGLYRLKILAGRNIKTSDTINEFLINETCAKKLGFKKPEEAIGKLLEVGMSDTRSPKKCPIVGILADFHAQSLHEAIAPLYFCASDDFSRSLSIKLATAGKDADHFSKTLAGIARVWKQVYPNEKFEYHFFDETIARFYGKEQKTAQIMNTAMGIAIFISCMGLFGLAAFIAEQRRKEIAIRKVLGAGIGSIIARLTRDFVVLVLIAIVIASPVGWYFMHQWLQDFAYRISLNGWVIFLAGAGAITIALLTVSVQAIRAAVANPIKALRSE